MKYPGISNNINEKMNELRIQRAKQIQHLIVSLIFFFVTLIITGLCLNKMFEVSDLTPKPMHFVFWIICSIITAMIVFCLLVMIDKINLEKGNTGDELPREQN